MPVSIFLYEIDGEETPPVVVVVLRAFHGHPLSGSDAAIADEISCGIMMMKIRQEH